MAFIAENGRNKLWFGTQERAGWFPTPNRGADMGASGWSAEGTTLNGGGFQLNSFGSHRQYIFEWPASSAPEVAQLMKSYADGTYGRGLIYFLDPLIYETNVLPAMWADPSMGVGQEGASLVYGVEAIGLPTSGWEVNNLPVTSAFYDLSGVSAGWRGKEDAVFIPVPEGYTLSFGAIGSATGTGGVFYRTQSRNGALSAVSSVSLLGVGGVLVNELISGSDLAGVWFYVGRSSSVNSSVTLTALTARLLKSSEAESRLMGINYAPRIEGSGSWAEVARFVTGDEPPEFDQMEDFRVRDLGTGESVLEIEKVAGFSPTNAIGGLSTDPETGEPAIRYIKPASGLSILQTPTNYVPTQGGTVLARGTTLEAWSGGRAQLAVSSPLQNTYFNLSAPRTESLTLKYGDVLTSAYRLQLRTESSVEAGTEFWWSNLGLFEGDYDGPFWNGDTGFITIGGIPCKTQWEDDGTSTLWTATPVLDRIKTRPWIGGQGHSGCRFVGKPTYIANTGVGGGQVGFAASFREVGSWLYG